MGGIVINESKIMLPVANLFEQPLHFLAKSMYFWVTKD